MKPVTSPQNETIKFIRSLANKRRRQNAGLFVAEGDKVLARARACGWVPKYLITRNGSDDGWAEETLLASESVLRAVSTQENPTGATGVFAERWAAVPTTGDLWLVLDTLRDPGNLGTIIRTADAAGASGVILTGEGCDPYGAEAVRATMGSLFATPLVRMTTPALAALAQHWPGEIIGTAMAATEDYRRSYRAPALLMLGSEATGLAPALQALCSTTVRIPMAGPVESLNVAIAAALVMYEIRRSTGL